MFQYMNQTYARKERSFDDSEGIRKAAEAVSGADLGSFFTKYVAGTDEIPYDDFLAWVGLHVVTREKTVSDPGFRAARNFNLAPVVVYVQPDSDAAHAGLVPGDTVLTLDGAQVSRDFEAWTASRPVGEVLHVRIRAANGAERDLMWKLGARKTLEYEVTEVEGPTLQQLLHRRSWLTAREAKVTHAKAYRGTGVRARTSEISSPPKSPQSAPRLPSAVETSVQKSVGTSAPEGYQP
jgi:predicted metalloprotease with PDZ domain